MIGFVVHVLLMCDLIIAVIWKYVRTSNDDFITTRHHHRRLIGENICECLRAAGKCISTHFRIREKRAMESNEME